MKKKTVEVKELGDVARILKYFEKIRMSEICLLSRQSISKPFP